MKLSEVAKRRVAVFKANKRGYYSLVLFCVLFFMSLFAEFIANDRPIFISFESKYYFPTFKDYTEKDFNGELDLVLDYKDEYAKELLKDAFILWPIVRFSYDTINYDLKSPAPSPPDLVNPLGTDDQARDVFARVLYGFRISVLFGLSLTILSSIIGISVGAIQGYKGGLVDLLGQRFIEIWASMPSLYILMILINYITPTFWWLLWILLLFSWTALVGVVRAEFLRMRNFDFVLAARSMGVSEGKIMTRHILPNALIATVTFMPFILSGSIVTLTSLDFLGFGLPPGSPSLGELLSQGKANLNAPWLGISAFVVLSAILTMLVFVGEAFRDALDSRLTQ